MNSQTITITETTIVYLWGTGPSLFVSLGRGNQGAGTVKRLDTTWDSQLTRAIVAFDSAGLLLKTRNSKGRRMSLEVSCSIHKVWGRSVEKLQMVRGWDGSRSDGILTLVRRTKFVRLEGGIR